jgi:two-component system nitrate/nitrite response regulator NarL
MAGEAALPLTSTSVISAAIVATSPLIRAGLKAALEEGGVRVTTSAETLDDLALAADAGCDVVVVDMPPDGALKEQRSPGHGRALVLLADLDNVDVGVWLADGVSLLPRSADGPTIRAAIVAAVAGLVAAPPELLEHALRHGPAPSAGVPHADFTAADLTAREIEVLSKLASGCDNRAIAEALHISPHTAKFHVGQIIAKLGASSRTEAVAKALRARLVRSD